MEGNRILYAGKDIYFQTKKFVANINVSDICNFSCSYCINSTAMARHKRVLDKDILVNFLEDLGERQYEQYTFGIAGGEPMIYPHLSLLVASVEKCLPGNDKKIFFATNASLLPQREEQLYAAAGNTRLLFMVSVHLEQIQLDSFVRSLADFGHPEDLQCKILLAPGKLEEAKIIQSAFAETGIQTFATVVSHPGGTPYAYSDAEMEFLEQYKALKSGRMRHVFEDGHVEEYDRISGGLYPDIFSYPGMICGAGVCGLRLAPDGTVARCFGFLQQGAQYQLGERRLRDIPELLQPCRCPAQRCHCATFRFMPKWRRPEDAPVYLRGVPVAE